MATAPASHFSLAGFCISGDTKQTGIIDDDELGGTGGSIAGRSSGVLCLHPCAVVPGRFCACGAALLKPGKGSSLQEQAGWHVCMCISIAAGTQTREGLRICLK